LISLFLFGASAALTRGVRAFWCILTANDSENGSILAALWHEQEIGQIAIPQYLYQPDRSGVWGKLFSNANQ